MIFTLALTAWIISIGYTVYRGKQWQRVIDDWGECLNVPLSEYDHKRSTEFSEKSAACYDKSWKSLWIMLFFGILVLISTVTL